MWWLLKGFLSLALGLPRSRHYNQDAFCQDDICHEDDSGYDDQRESGESVHCAGLHEAVRPAVPWQVRGLHQLDALAHFGGTLQVLQFLIGTGWYLFSTIRCSILTQSCLIRIPATYSTTVLHPSVLTFYNIIVIEYYYRFYHYHHQQYGKNNCRAILSTLTVEEINGDRIKFAKLVSEMASPDLGRSIATSWSLL